MERKNTVNMVLDERGNAGRRTQCARADEALDEMEPGILPVAPLTRTFAVAANGKRISISRQQLPITLAYTFIDYHTQAQTIEYCLENIGSPPSGRFMPSNAYAALSCSQGRDNIRLLRGFDERRIQTNTWEKRTLGSKARPRDEDEAGCFPEQTGSAYVARSTLYRIGTGRSMEANF